MHLVGSSPRLARRVTAVEVVDLELAGTWVVDARRAPRPAAREGWLVPWEDGIAFLADTPHLDAEEASERLWPLDAA